MNLAPTELDPSRQVQSPTLGRDPGRGRLAGRRVLVVGAGQRSIPEENPPIGNGRAISVLFAREGAAVACVDVSREALDGTCGQIDREGGQSIAEVADVRDAAAIGPLVARCAERLGGLDGLVLNVGISRGLPLHKITAETWDDEFAVNLRSHMLFSQAALPLMAPGGSIVLISSIAGLRNSSRNPAYETSKAGQISLARAVAVAGEEKGIRCNAVLPGLMDTPMGRDATRRRPGRAAAVPFGRQGTGWEVAQCCLFLVSHEASYVNAHALVVDGGLSSGVVRPA
ncbi:MAG: SDR family oxidoreductase [Burkholderiales bacterium]|nr:SDR family oxidoreductase [Burkholderiales bacterium]